MKNEKVLEMINGGNIEELKKMLQAEIFEESLKSTPDAKKRFAAMKRFFKYDTGLYSAYGCTVPCENVEIYGTNYNSFCNGHCFALTTESIGNLDRFDKEKSSYFDMKKFVDAMCNCEVHRMNIASVLAEAKSKGYKLNKKEVGKDTFSSVWKFKNATINLALLDLAYSIIADGKDAEVYYSNPKAVVYIKTAIGIAGILPFCNRNGNLEGKIIVE